MFDTIHPVPSRDKLTEKKVGSHLGASRTPVHATIGGLVLTLVAKIQHDSKSCHVQKNTLNTVSCSSSCREEVPEGKRHGGVVVREAKKVVGSTPGPWTFCVEFSWSPSVCMGSF